MDQPFKSYRALFEFPYDLKLRMRSYEAPEHKKAAITCGVPKTDSRKKGGVLNRDCQLFCLSQYSISSMFDK